MNERLELIEKRLKATKELPNLPKKLSPTEEFFSDMDWLIARSKWAEYYGNKLGELNQFLQGRIKGRAGDSVIDASIYYIKYLESKIDKGEC